MRPFFMYNASMLYYKIRNKNDPTLFRLSDGRWNKSGKVYDTLGKLRATITNKLNSHWGDVRKQVQDWEIVEFEVIEKEVKQVHEVIKPERLMDLLSKQYRK